MPEILVIGESQDFYPPGEQFKRIKFGDRFFYTHKVSVRQSPLETMNIAENIRFARQIITGTRDSRNGKSGKVLHTAKVILSILR